MLPALASLIAVQALDTAVDTARRRLAELPGVEKELDQQVAAASIVLDEANAKMSGNQQARLELEKQVAVVDGRLTRFDEHKAAVKTNQEFTALLHEIEVARGGKDALESGILELLEEADRIAASVTDAQRALAASRSQADVARKALAAERSALEADIARLTAERATATQAIDAAQLAKYEQLLKQRRMVAVAPLKGDTCGGCNVRLRPAMTQSVRRGTEIVTCDSCQRILYARPAADTGAEPQAQPARSS